MPARPFIKQLELAYRYTRYRIHMAGGRVVGGVWQLSVHDVPKLLDAEWKALQLLEESGNSPVTIQVEPGIEKETAFRIWRESMIRNGQVTICELPVSLVTEGPTTVAIRAKA